MRADKGKKPTLLNDENMLKTTRLVCVAQLWLAPFNLCGRNIDHPIFRGVSQHVDRGNVPPRHKPLDLHNAVGLYLFQ